MNICNRSRRSKIFSSENQTKATPETVATVQPVAKPIAQIDKPWGHEILWASTPEYLGKILFVKAGHSLSLQFHNFKEETMYVESGECIIETGPDAEHLTPYPCRPGMIFHVPPKCLHRIRATSDCRIFEVSTAFPTDVVRIQDQYGRKSS